jgi:hypothetical protein
MARSSGRLARGLWNRGRHQHVAAEVVRGDPQVVRRDRGVQVFVLLEQEHRRVVGDMLHDDLELGELGRPVLVVLVEQPLPVQPVARSLAVDGQRDADLLHQRQHILDLRVVDIDPVFGVGRHALGVELDRQDAVPLGVFQQFPVEVGLEVHGHVRVEGMTRHRRLHLLLVPQK